MNLNKSALGQSATRPLLSQDTSALKRQIVAAPRIQPPGAIAPMSNNPSISPKVQSVPISKSKLIATPFPPGLRKVQYRPPDQTTLPHPGSESERAISISSEPEEVSTKPPSPIKQSSPAKSVKVTNSTKEVKHFKETKDIKNVKAEPNSSLGGLQDEIKILTDAVRVRQRTERVSEAKMETRAEKLEKKKGRVYNYVVVVLTKQQVAPRKVSKIQPQSAPFRIGDRVETHRYDGWHYARIKDIKLPLYYIHYEGWNIEWDEWVDRELVRKIGAGNPGTVKVGKRGRETESKWHEYAGKLMCLSAISTNSC